ncbi:hypothetical protein ZIOFF_001522 [Zingiber officinale]|uniref:RNase H type-1 domain-containing protein n=1 Tax=Zingiber officinale TaxID=94328 RepID=A0A8J5I3I2_ZINOF|nr:hypothetical protein ZIOFF_001522 [Zingiber officinale]
MASRIFGIWEDGICLEKPELIQKSGVKFFEELLTGKEFVMSDDSLEQIPSLLSSEDNHFLLNLPTLKEVKVAMEVWCFFAKLFTVSGWRIFERWKIGMEWSRDGHVREAIPFLVIWFLWVARNEAKNQGIKLSTQRIIRNVTRYLMLGLTAGNIRNKHWRGFRLTASMLGIQVKVAIINTYEVVYWRKPKAYFKLNTDGCAKGNLGSSSYGIIVRDQEGKVLVAKHGSIVEGLNLRAELFGIWKGLEANVATDYLANQAFDFPMERSLSDSEIDRMLFGICRVDRIGLPYLRMSCTFVNCSRRSGLALLVL